jgi:hypothetical protein
MIPFDNYSLEQCKYFHFGDKRLDARALNCANTLIKGHMDEGFPCIFNDQYELKAFYRLMNNSKVSPEGFSDGYTIGLKQLLKKISESAPSQVQTFYQFQDTTYGSYLNRKNLDLGYIENKNDNGLVLHTSLLTDDQFTPIGIANQQFILRDRSLYQKGHQRKQRPFEEKESHKWVEALKWSVSMQQEHNIRIIHVADREADMKEFFNYAFDNQLDVIVRVRHDRRVLEEDARLWVHLRDLPEGFLITRQLLSQDGKPYQAKCEINWTTVQLRGISAPLHVVYLKQLDELHGGTAAQWAIFTTQSIATAQQAEDILDLYTHRWRTCEDFHKCLKSGCSMEQRQFESSHALTNCVAILSIAALHLLRLRHLATLENQPIEEILLPEACVVVDHLARKHLKPVDLKTCKPRTALWLALLLGRMGGHQGIHQKGLPGWKTLWRGWYDFQKIMDGIILSKNIFESS